MVKAALLYGPRDMRIESMPDEIPARGELLLEVTAVGICGSDLHNFLDGQIGGVTIESPLVLGHEAAGRIIALGEGTADRFRVGQSVAIDPGIACGQCERCLEGNPNLCMHLEFLGIYPRHGALRERMVHPARQCVPLPAGIDSVAGALLEPLGVALHASQLAKIGVNDDVLIVGAGGIGLLLVQLARLAGAKRIFVSDLYEWRLDMARRMGATATANADREDVVAAVHQATEGRGVDVAIESAWVDRTASQCVEAVRLGGRVVVVGIPLEDVLTVRASAARRKGLTIRLSRRMKHAYGPSIDLVVGKQIDVASLATHRWPLDQAKAALETASSYADGVIRAMVLPVS